LALAVVVPFACSSPTSTATTVVRPELIAVDPDDFMGHVKCEAPPVPVEEGAGGTTDAPVARDPDAVHSYVATLFDVTDGSGGSGGAPKHPIPLASSGPTTCVQQATFAFVVQYRRYIAEIDAYHEEPNELHPISPGSRVMNKADGSRAIRGWNVAVCGGYPPSPGSGGAGGGGAGGGGGGEDASVGGGGVSGGGLPGIISYPSITQTPHNCSAVLVAPKLNQADPEPN